MGITNTFHHRHYKTSTRKDQTNSGNWSLWYRIKTKFISKAEDKINEEKDRRFEDLIITKTQIFKTSIY